MSSVVHPQAPSSDVHHLPGMTHASSPQVTGLSQPELVDGHKFHPTTEAGSDDISHPGTVAFDEAMLDHYTDSDLFSFIENAPNFVTTRVEATKVLSQNLVAKIIHDTERDDEIAATEFARKLGILVPAVRRALIHPATTRGSCLVLERVHGRTLEQLWAEIGWWRTLRVAWQLRRYLQKMHAVTSLKAGGLATGSVRSLFFQGLYPPVSYASPEAFTGYINWWLTKCRPRQRQPRHDLTLKPLRRHVFVHQDLAPRNMILDARNRLWLIDWGFAGFYPPYLEYLAIEATEMPWLRGSTWHARLARWRWTVLRWIAAGPRGPHIRPFKALGEVHRRSCLFRTEKTPYSQVD
ncbi:hypothetical protein BV22DRAFT_1041927 [Leucogyrophana mollusca]|uniref:Uncharacterized protein n=1 Tax=Leucogyrophana mollusca TaxID=85980 RepID=A0ACB8AXV3_9AGAM|nr:hypothetical protein BV22DRAFT_1041927 [Leucogyrophana mollusca]